MQNINFINIWFILRLMIRRAIQLAGKTLVLSLPSKWVKQYNIKKGDELEIAQCDDSLTISCQNRETAKIGKIDITGANYSVAWHYIVSAYCSGFDELEIVFDKLLMQDNKNNTTIKVSDAILKIVNNLIGLEVIRQGKNFCLVKEVSKTQKDEFPNMLKRLFFLILSIGEDSLEALKNGDKQTLANVLLLEANVNKFSHYCLRTLNKFFNEQKDFAFIIRALEMISDKYCFLIKSTGADKNGFVLFSQINSLLRQFYEAFYDTQPRKIIEFYSQMSGFKQSVLKQKLENKYVFVDILDLAMESLNAKLFMGAV